MKLRMLQIVLITSLVIMESPALCAQDAAHRPIANVGPVDIDFGSINIGVSKLVPVTVRNLTDQPMTLAGGGIASTDGFGGYTGTCGAGLGAGDTCQLQYEFRPTFADGTLASASTGLQITAGDETVVVPIHVRGRGVGTLVDITPTTIDFGDTFLGQTVSIPVTITNRGDFEVSFAGGGFSVSNGFDGNAGTCGLTLAAGATCQFFYSFTPNSIGLLTNNTGLQITQGVTSIVDGYPIAVRGTGVTAVNLVHVRPVQMNLGRVQLGREALVPIHFTNTSSGVVNYAGGGFDAIGSDGGAFGGFLGGGAGCTSNTADVGATCAIHYRLRPHEARTFNGSTAMSFSRNMVDQFQTFQFTGVGVGTLGQVSPLFVDFGIVDLNTTISVPVVVHNDGDQDLTGFLGGAVSSPFGSSSSCIGTLAPGSTCTLNYTFTANSASIGLHETQTALTFRNTQGIQPVYTITLRARATATLLTDGFE